MTSHSWVDRPLPPLPPEAFLDPELESSGARPPTQQRSTHRTNASLTVRAADRDGSFQPASLGERPIHDTIPTLLSPGRPTHSRSMSNPFPAFFSGKKKKDQSQPLTSPTGPGLPGNSDTSRKQGPINIPSQGNAQDRRRKPVLGPHDFKTGHCMTCASLVRWPKDLLVFRCTICMTVNDIEPLSSRQVPVVNILSHDDGGTSTDSISISHTKSLVKQCLVSSIQRYLAGVRDSQNGPSIGRTPVSVAKNDHVAPRNDGHRRTQTFDDRTSGPKTTPRATVNPMSSFRSQSFSTSYPESNNFATMSQAEVEMAENAENVFRKLEDYLMVCIKSHSCINNSFCATMTIQPTKKPEHSRIHTSKTKHLETHSISAPDLSDLDPRLLMLGDFAENGSWWTGGQDATKSQTKPAKHSHIRTKSSSNRLGSALVQNAESLGIDWLQVVEWYESIVHAPNRWREVYEDLVAGQPDGELSAAAQQRFESILESAHHRLLRVFLKCIEGLLKRPGTPISNPQDARFLVILMCNPLLTTSAAISWGARANHERAGQTKTSSAEVVENKSGPSRHSGIIKRILGIMANTSEDCHRYLASWLSDMPDDLFLQAKDLTASFVTYRLSRQNEKVVEAKVNVIDSLVPQMSEATSRSNTVSLHAALHGGDTGKAKSSETKQSAYTDDWQIKAAAKVMALIFAANEPVQSFGTTRKLPHGDRRPLPVSDFYHSLVDTLEFKTDFELWESKRAKFTFCEYPFFLSIWAKIQILEYDAKRQMSGKAREAFFDSILSHRKYAQHLVLKIRRDCLVDDSLKTISQVVGSGSEDIKKALRIEFDGEEGVDAGGLRKEWFLLLVREVFNPDHGLFVYDNDSQLCYFNPHSFETSDQYFLVGVVLGLAIYNSTILDIALPPFAFRRLLAASPTQGTGGHPKPAMTYTLHDLAELRPALARGLQQLLDYDGDVQADFCLDFVVETERYGSRVRVPLCHGGEAKMVTAANRREYVDLLVRYHLETSVTRQFEPFKRGFFTVCGGNALSLFRPEEIELLVRGSDETLDVASLRGAAEYSDWPKDSTPETEATIQWFWQTFEEATASDQRRLLAFITGSDRIPATGAAALTIKVHCLGDDEGRFPSARTCFNMLSLYRCRTPQQLQKMLWRAVYESEGFGLK